MEADPSDIAISSLLAAVGAIVTALLVGYIAHYDLGFSRQEIRTEAVIGAVIIGLLVTIEYLGKKLRKPK
jgi:NhaP-type Na+/H+ and K+/H+ antiporter